MTKEELLRVAADKFKVSQREADEVITGVFNLIKELMIAGEKVPIPGFGKFVIAQREAREYRNPATNGKIMISATNIPKFEASAIFKKQINE